MRDKLKESVINIGCSAKSFIRENRAFFLWLMLFSVVLYYRLMAEELVNCYDGIWVGSYHRAGEWELSLGRWFWPIIDCLRMGVSCDPMASLMTLICYSLGLVFCADLLGCKNAPARYLAGVLFLSSQSVLISLSYRFMSPTFGAAFLLGILGMWLCAGIKSFLWGMLAGSVCICLSLGAYQAFIGCTCLALIGWIIRKVREGAANPFLLLLKGACTILLGGIEYLIIWEMGLGYFHIAKSNYAGADTYSFLNMIIKFPKRMMDVFQCFGLYFKNVICKELCFGGTVLPVLFFILAAVILAVDIVRILRSNKKGGILYLLMLAAVPAAAGAVLFAATDTVLSIQMTGALALVAPILVLLLSGVEKRALLLKMLYLAVSFTAVVVLYSQILQTQIDQKTMSETRTSSMNVVAEIHGRLGAEELLSEELRYCFIGVPAGNPMYYRSETFWTANGYTYIGGGWPDSWSVVKAWNGLVRHICRINMEICSADEYNMLSAEEEVVNMPVFPAQGSVIRIGDIVVIKVS